MNDLILMTIAVVLLLLGSVVSYRYPRAGFFSAVAAVMTAFLACASPEYGIFILLIGILNLISLDAIRSKIRGIDYGLVGFMVIVTMYIFNTAELSLVLASFVLVSVPTYILVMMREDEMDVEVGVKYIVFMVIATVLFLTGAIILAKGIESLYVLGYVALILGLALELGIAPLHEWVPDIFARADPVPLSIIASIAKIVPFVVAFRILYSTATELTGAVMVFTALLAATSMFIGNIGALTSREHGRVLGYSTVANMGYLMSSLLAVTEPEFLPLALAGGLLLLFSNACGKIGFFSAMKGEDAYSPFTYMLSFSFLGVPPLIGFWGKLFIAITLIRIEYVWLAVILLINSAVSIPYYLRLAKELGKSWHTSLTGFIVLASVLITLITIAPNWFVDGIEALMPLILIEMGG